MRSDTLHCTPADSGMGRGQRWRGNSDLQHPRHQEACVLQQGRVCSHVQACVRRLRLLVLSRVKVRSVTSPAAIPDLAQQIVGKCRLIHSSKVCRSTASWQKLCCTLSTSAQLYFMLLQIPQVEALLHELLQRDSGNPGLQVKPGQLAIAYSECPCSTRLPSHHACNKQSWDDAALLLARALEPCTVMSSSLQDTLCTGYALHRGGADNVYCTCRQRRQAAAVATKSGTICERAGVRA